MTSFMHEKRRLSDTRATKQQGAMPMKAIRNFAWSAERLEELAQRHPNLVVREGGDLLLAQPLGAQLALHYAFESVEAMRQRFAAMLEQIEAVAQSDGYQRLYLTFNDNPNRVFIEPIFHQSAFAVAYEWVSLLREDLSSAPAAARAVREAASGDMEAAAALEAACYPAAPLGRAELRDSLAGGDALLVAGEGGQLVGYALLKLADVETPQVARLGVRPEQRRQGVGDALIAASLERLRKSGHLRATALAPIDSKAALGLCRKAGFAPRHTLLLYAKEPGARPKRTLGLIGIRGSWETSW